MWGLRLPEQARVIPWRKYRTGIMMLACQAQRDMTSTIERRQIRVTPLSLRYSVLLPWRRKEILSTRCADVQEHIYILLRQGGGEPNAAVDTNMAE